MELRHYLELLQDQHDQHMKEAYSKLTNGADNNEMAATWAYGAGLLHAIRTIEDAIKSGNL